MGGSIWDRIVVALNGEHVALLGPRLSGKTTLYAYMLNDTEPATQTLGPEPRPWCRNKTLGLNLHKGVDLPGGEGNLADWRSQFAKSSKVFYLFDVHRTRTEVGYAERVRQDGRRMREWGPDGKRIMLLGTHADTDPLASELRPAEYLDHIADLDVIAALQTRAKIQSLAIGSLRTSVDAVTLVQRALVKS